MKCPDCNLEGAKKVHSTKKHDFIQCRHAYLGKRNTVFMVDKGEENQ